jgi:hypothetical protein
MTKQEFIEKWTVIWADPEIKNIMVKEMESDLKFIDTPMSEDSFKEMMLNAFKEGFDSATESLIAANKTVQEKKP